MKRRMRLEKSVRFSKLSFVLDVGNFIAASHIKCLIGDDEVMSGMLQLYRLICARKPNIPCRRFRKAVQTPNGMYASTLNRSRSKAYEQMSF